VRLGNYAQVIALEAESIARSRAISDLELTSLSLHNKAYAHRALGELPEALSCATESVALARQLDARLALAHALAQLAEAQVAAACQERDWMEAAANFREAAASFRGFGKLVMAYQAEIGLAALLWRRGDIAAARAQVAALVPHLPTDAADGWDEPLRAYVVCTQILQAAGHPLADSILEQGLRLLEGLGGNIGDAGLRERFLQAVPSHRELRTLHAARLA
jgi:tetratricopeptide (TPR) repeat protein